MPPALQDEIRQTRPFGSLHQEAYLNVGRTAAALEGAMEQLLKQHGVSLAQYNVLRILGGAGAAGLGRNEIRDRLVTRMPDVTRLLDRLEEMGSVRRARCTEDRRQMTTYLTASGEVLLDELAAPVAAEHLRQLDHLTEAQLRMLIALATLARQPV
jgi:DNA-binding MarR family transcriptional regulator